MSFIDVLGKKHEKERLEASMLDSFASDLGASPDRVKNITSKPMTDADLLPDEDRDELATLRGVAEIIETLLSSGRRAKALVMLHDYIGGFMSAYQAKLKTRVKAGDKSAMASAYVACLACVKVASRLIPVIAQKAYLEGFKDLEHGASVEIVFLPGDIML